MNPNAATRKYGISDIALVRLSIRANASRDQYVLMTKSCTMMLVTHSATTGTPFLFSRANARGMSSFFEAACITSAQISDQAR
ncbi:hypothetical protein D3C72_1353320 [compost metagenome]